MTKLKRSLKQLSSLEAQQQSKRNMYEESERIAAMGQESDKKAAKWVSEDFREKEKIDLDQKFDAYMVLEDLTRNRLKYNQFLVKLFYRFVKDEDINPKYQVYAQATKLGVIVGIAGGWNSAFKTCGIPKYDFYAAKMMAVRTGNTVAKLEGYHRQTDEGIFVADQFDVKRFATKSTATS